MFGHVLAELVLQAGVVAEVELDELCAGVRQILSRRGAAHGCPGVETLGQGMLYEKGTYETRGSGDEDFHGCFLGKWVESL